MITLTIDREKKKQDRTLGTLTILNNNVVVDSFCTLELPWKDNKKNISCIPTGKYIVERYSSHRFPNTFKILNVPERSDILIHAGNYPKDTAGCVLVGSDFDSNGNLLKSRDALRKINEYLDYEEEMELVIS